MVTIAMNYLYYLQMINNIVTEFSSSYTIVCGDFNANVNYVKVLPSYIFGKELVNSVIMSHLCYLTSFYVLNPTHSHILVKRIILCHG